MELTGSDENQVKAGPDKDKEKTEPDGHPQLMLHPIV